MDVVVHKLACMIELILLEVFTLTLENSVDCDASRLAKAFSRDKAYKF